MKRVLTLIGMLFATCLAGSITAANATEYPLPPAIAVLLVKIPLMLFQMMAVRWRLLLPITKSVCWVCWKQTQVLTRICHCRVQC